MQHATPSQFSSTSVGSQEQHMRKPMNNLSQYAHKGNLDFVMHSRQKDSNDIRAAFLGTTQKEISEKAGKTLGVSPRTVIKWLQKEHDMPSWARKAIDLYLNKLDVTTRRIEGRT